MFSEFIDGDCFNDFVSSPSSAETSKAQPLEVKPQPKPKRPKHKWTEEEDIKLKKIVLSGKCKTWTDICFYMEGRNPKQCRERWISKLSPGLSLGSFTLQEDIMILYQYRNYGRSWKQISCYMPGRSPIAIKNRFNFLDRHKSDLNSLYNKYHNNQRCIYMLYQQTLNQHQSQNQLENPQQNLNNIFLNFEEM